MSDLASSQPPPQAGDAETFSALFAEFVLQQTNLALMFLGRMPNPETGQATPNLEAAQLLISQLEMLEAKTKGNLTKEEQTLLKHSLTTVRLAFVEAVEQPPAPAQPAAAPAPTGPPAQSQPAPETASTAAETESRKKFFKKY